uniref:SRCR domain-containing protein n=1 Tax=Hucho hucho TaxID=62062 RepID=A0A4W5L2G8_9TELE
PACSLFLTNIFCSLSLSLSLSLALSLSLSLSISPPSPPSPCLSPEICVISEAEDLSASVDVQDVYTKIKCKVGSFNMDQYQTRPGEGWHCGRYEGAILQCQDTAVVRPSSRAA